MSQVISRSSLLELAGRWIAAGHTVWAPTEVKPSVVLYAKIAQPDRIWLDAGPRPANSIKECVFPRHERLYGYRLEGKQVELVEVPAQVPRQVVLAARPCDAAALPILDHVFRWDYQDTYYNRRREATVVVTLACREPDSECFCTSVGLGPDNASGSDAMLLELADGQYEVRVFSEKGRELFAGPLQESSQSAAPAQAPPAAVDLAAVGQWFDGRFENEAWPEMARSCLGCGACAFNCPTCHCFDIVDEGNGAGGWRVRNWDACQFGMFTLHASGHNPRHGQDQRQRQRIYHKFEIYRKKFGATLCTGCGNCTRNCPVHLGVRPVLEQIAAAASEQIDAKT